MLDALFGVFSNDLAIDLGTANTLIYVKNLPSSRCNSVTSGGERRFWLLGPRPSGC